MIAYTCLRSVDPMLVILILTLIVYSITSRIILCVYEYRKYKQINVKRLYKLEIIGLIGIDTVIVILVISYTIGLLLANGII